MLRRGNYCRNSSMPDAFFDLNDAEFAPIKARLLRAFLEHKADLGYRSQPQRETACAC